MRASKWIQVRNIWLAAGLVLGAVSCSKEPTTFVPNAVDRFTAKTTDNYTQASKLLQADYVFMMDVAWSLFDKRNELRDTMLNFSGYLRASGIDYRVGVVNGNVHDNTVSNMRNVSNNFIGGTFLDAAGVASVEGNLVNLILGVGLPLQENAPVLFEAAEKTMDAQAGSFIRPGSQLVYVFVSDIDDQSARVASDLGADSNYGDTSAGSYKNKLLSYKGSSFTSARAIVTGYNGCTPRAAYNEEKGERIAQMARDLDSVLNTESAVSSCVRDNFDDVLEDLAKNVTKPLDKFLITAGDVDPDRVEVLVNGAPQTRGTHWTLSGNEITFLPSSVPAFDDNVVIRYQSYFRLSNPADPSTILVEVGGQSVTQDAVNGWIYNENDNRIIFNGTAIPANDAEIVVTYNLL